MSERASEQASEREGMTMGVSVVVNGRRCKIFARWGGAISDEPATKDLLDCKGHAGIRCCFYVRIVLWRGNQVTVETMRFPFIYFQISA